MTQTVDLLVIGTGAAGAAPAYRARRAGWTVAIVDKRPYGGTCALRGCDPKKVLVGAADLLDWYRRMQGRGVAGERVHVDWPALIRFKRTFTEPVPQDREQGYHHAGVATFHGLARFVDAQTIRVGE